MANTDPIEIKVNISDNSKQVAKNIDDLSKSSTIALRKLVEAPSINIEQEAKKIKAILFELQNTKLTNISGENLKSIAEFISKISKDITNITGVDFSGLSSFVNMGSSLAKQDYFNAAASGLGLISSIFSSAAAAKERERKIQEALNKLQKEYNDTLIENKFNIADTVDYTRIYKDNIEKINYLIKQGVIDVSNFSVWESLNKDYKEAGENVDTYMNKTKQYESYVLDEFGRLTGIGRKQNIGHSYKDFEYYDRAIPSLVRYINGEIDLIELSKELKAAGWSRGDLSDELVNAAEKTKEWNDKLVAVKKQLDEMSVGDSFDGFLQGAINALDQMRLGVGDLSNFTKESLTKAILSSFKYQILAKAIEPLYKQLADRFIDGVDVDDAEWVKNWKSEFEKTLGGKSEELNKIFESFGLSTEDIATTKSTPTSTASVGVASMSQDSANELNGNFYAIRQQVGDITNLSRESILIQRTMQTQLTRVAENTEYCRYLENVKNSLEDIQTRGVKVKV